MCLEAAIQLQQVHHRHKLEDHIQLVAVSQEWLRYFLGLSLDTWRLSEELASNKGQHKGECSRQVPSIHQARLAASPMFLVIDRDACPLCQGGKPYVSF